MRDVFRDLIPVDEARDRLLAHAPSTGTERVPLDDAPGRVLAEPVDAPIDVPGFDRAAMDGYAVRADDTVGAAEDDPVRLDLVGTVHPGGPPTADPGPGEAVGISTGAVLPDGADAVVMVEDTETGDGRVAIRRAVAPGANVAPRGDDVGAGERVLPAGRVLDARDVGTVAALGIGEVPVRVRPVVAIVSTGEELRPVDAELGPGEIHDVNASSLAAAAQAAGAAPRFVGRVGDDEDAMRAILDEAAEIGDVVVTSGSTSASQIDVLYRVVDRAGELLFHGVDVKPGKPTFGARYRDRPVVGLPGYPVSALTTFRLFVVPVVRSALGRPAEERSDRVPARMASRVPTRGGRRRLLPVGLVAGRDGPRAYPVDRGSGATTSLVDADGVVDVPAGVQRLDADEEVVVSLLTGDAPADVVAGGEHCPGMHRVLDALPGRVKWLRLGGREAVRRAEAGIVDVLGTNVDAAPDGYVLAGSYARQLVLVDGGQGLALDELAGRRVARYAPGTGLRGIVDDLLGDVEPAWRGAFRSPPGCLQAVDDGTVAAAIVPGVHVADRSSAEVGRDEYAIWVREDRSDVRTALEEARIRDLVADLPGVEAAGQDRKG